MTGCPKGLEAGLVEQSLDIIVLVVKLYTTNGIPFVKYPADKEKSS
jgi:hypothetical protein